MSWDKKRKSNGSRKKAQGVIGKKFKAPKKRKKDKN